MFIVTFCERRRVNSVRLRLTISCERRVREVYRGMDVTPIAFVNLFKNNACNCRNLFNR